MAERSISILMATYNGERYVAEQLDALFGQSMQDFDLYVRDDCSTDGTVRVLRGYEQRYPGRIHVVVNQQNSGSAKTNFMRLILEHKNAYVMLCDQDDVWQPDKIERELKAMRDAEKEFGQDTPLLLHTDLQVADEHLHTRPASFREMEKLHYELNTLNRLLVQNIVTGCTAMMNRALADKICEMPDFCMMHDWWLALVASVFGKIVSMEAYRSVLYRQHSANQIGAEKALSMGYFARRLQRAKAVRTKLWSTCQQAACFESCFANQLPRDARDMLCAYARVPSVSKLERIRTLVRYRIWKHGFLRSMGQMIYI